jgi:hypothetical protein
MRVFQIFTCALFAFTSPSFADPASDYTATVQRRYIQTDDVKSIAILPYNCPVQLACPDFDRRLRAAIAASTQLVVLETDHARRVMEDAQFDKIDYTTRYILADSLGVDAFAIIEVQEASMQNAEPKMVKLGISLVPNPDRVKHVKLSLQLVKKDGTSLLGVSGQGRVVGISGDINGVALRTLKVALESGISK